MFRYLELHSGINDEPLRCSLRIAKIKQLDPDPMKSRRIWEEDANDDFVAVSHVLDRGNEIEDLSETVPSEWGESIKGQCIEFEAVSYVWGKGTKNQHIICNGDILEITTNLHKVLQCLRLPTASRRLWVDGICIDQDNLDEKGHQVAFMGKIYQAAKQVIVYLGPDKYGHGPRLRSLLKDVNDQIAFYLDLTSKRSF